MWGRLIDMKHTITFYTDDNEVKEIHDIRVTYFDQDDRVYCMNYKRSNKVEMVNNINSRISQRIEELNNAK